MTKTKLNVLLAKTDHMASSWKKAIEDYKRFFKNDQGQFKGVVKTYTPRDGQPDDLSKRGFTRIVTTVDEKLLWLSETFGEYFDAVFSQEATNASGTAKAELIVDGVSFGELTSLELLKLKSMLDHQDVQEMYGSIPVRPEDENWIPTKKDEYKDRAVYENEQSKGIAKTTEKESYILPNPDIDKLKSGMTYTPVVAQKTTMVELGDYTQQKFSGEWTHRQRAELLRRRSKLTTAIVEALKKANEVEAVKSNITGEKIFKYLHDVK